jgi:hypothetical protein
MSPVNMTFCIGHIDHRIAGRVRAAELHDVDPAVAEIDLMRPLKVVVGQVRPGMLSWPSNRRGKRCELAVPVFLTALGDHGARLLRHDDLLRTDRPRRRARARRGNG